MKQLINIETLPGTEPVISAATDPEPTTEERLDELEAAMIELAAIVGGVE